MVSVAKMKSLLLVLTLSVTAFAYVIIVPTSPSAGKGIGRFELIFRQKQLLSLFNNVCEKSIDSNIIRQANEFSADFGEGSYKDPEVLVRFKTFLQNGFLPENEIFSELNKNHYNEFLTIRDILVNAKDFDTFFAAAAWARQNVNCGLYVSTLYSAIVNREDTNNLYIPPPYEILPNYFFQKDAIIAGAFLLSGEDITFENVRNDGNSYVMSVNYTSDIEDEASSNKLAYFHEDIGINTLIFLKKLIFENLWQKGSDQLEVAEQIYHLMKQLSTRYNLERYSNNVYDSMGLDWTALIAEKYDPMLMYSNGKYFSGRTTEMDVSSVEYMEFLKNIENSVPSIVNRMVQNNYSKKEILKTLVETLVTGENSYVTIAFRNIGKTIDDTNGTPSSLEHYMTLARDPMFWKVNDKVVTLIENALSILPTYTRNELYFPGVQINNVDIKKVMTSVDNFIIDTTEALKPLSSNTTFQFKIEQPRLNHKAFSIKFNISSVVSQKGIIKVFLAPKLMPGELAKNKHQFMLLDSFETTLKKGANSITRTSNEIKSLSDDFWSLKTLEKYVEDAAFGLDTLNFESMSRFTGFPSRLAIPKGSEDGLPFQLFIFVAPLSKVISLSLFSKRIEYNSAALSPGYPLDLFVDDNMLFDLPNAFVKEILITHKKAGATKSGDFKKPYGKTDSYSYKKDELVDGYDNWETKKPTLKSTGFAGMVETSKKIKEPINEKIKSDKMKKPIIIKYEDITDTKNKPSSTSYESSSDSSKINVDAIDLNTRINKNIKVDFETSDFNDVEKSKVINKSFEDNKKSVTKNKINKNIRVETDNSFDEAPQIIEKMKVINKSFDDWNDIQMGKNFNIDSQSNKNVSFSYFKDEVPKTMIRNNQTVKTVEKSPMIDINTSFDYTTKSKKISKDIKTGQDFMNDAKINKNVKIDGSGKSFYMQDQFSPKIKINDDQTSETIEKNKVINKAFEDINKSNKDTNEIVMHKDINDDGSKKITIDNFDVNKVNPDIEINEGLDEIIVKTINSENNVQKSFSVVDKNTPSISLLKLSKSKDIVTSGDTMKIVVDDQDSSDKNTDISIAKDDGTNVEIHRIWDGPVLMLAADNEKPFAYEYRLEKPDKDVHYNDYELVYE